MPTLRAAHPRDAAAIAALDVETWRSTYAGVLPTRLLLDLSEARRREMWLHAIRRTPRDVLLAEDDDGAVVGFGNCGRVRGEPRLFAGEVFTLYVGPAAQGLGFGRLLLHGLFGRLVEHGAGSAGVWVLRANPSRFFYEGLGGRLCAVKPIPIGGAEVEAVAYAWPNLVKTLETLRARG